MTLRQSSKILTDKIVVNVKIVKVKTPWHDDTKAQEQSWKMTKVDFEFKLINSKLFLYSKENIPKTKCLILEIEVISMQIISICNLTD
jgi:hypothetical protein